MVAGRAEGPGDSFCPHSTIHLLSKLLKMLSLSQPQFSHFLKKICATLSSPVILRKMPKVYFQIKNFVLPFSEMEQLFLIA